MEITLLRGLQTAERLYLFQPLACKYWTAGNSVRLIVEALELIANEANKNSLNLPAITILLDQPNLLSQQEHSYLERSLVSACPENQRIVRISDQSAELDCLAEPTAALLIPFDPSGEVMQCAVSNPILNHSLTVNLTLHIIPHFAAFLNAPPTIYPCNVLQAVQSALADQDSRDIFENLMLVRQSGVVANIKKSVYPQYSHPKVLSYLRGLSGSRSVFIDCGSTDAREIESIISQCPGVFKYVHGFEPGSELKQFAIEDTSVSILPKAVLHQSGTFYLHGEGIGARVSSSRIGIDDLEIQAVSIDEVCQDPHLGTVSLIRMDIEGSEYDALMGARRTICLYKPALVVCLYHKPSDIVRIPLLVQSIHPHYDIYIGHHNPHCLYETVMYCVPHS